MILTAEAPRPVWPPNAGCGFEEGLDGRGDVESTGLSDGVWMTRNELVGIDSGSL